MSNKEIAKDILIKIIECNGVVYDQFPDAETYVDAVCDAYKKILATVNED